MRAELHVVLYSTRESCPMLTCWLSWASYWLVDKSYDYQLHTIIARPNISSTSSGTWKTELWYAALRDKLVRMRDYIERVPLGSTVFFTDLDVVPMRPMSTLLPLPHELTFMREPPGHGGRTGRQIVNTGLYALRVTPSTRRYVSHWAWFTIKSAARRTALQDQHTANWILLAKKGSRMAHPDLDWGTWPRSLATGLLADVGNATAAFHAIFTTGDQKVQRIAEALERRRAALPTSWTPGRYNLPPCRPSSEVAACAMPD